MKRTLILFAALVAVIVAGCGGGGGDSGSSGGQTVDELVRSGTEKLDAMLADSTPVTAANLNAALQNFRDARAKDGNNARANGGFAMLMVAYDAQRIIDLFQIDINRSTGDPSMLERRLSGARFGFLASPMMNLKIEDAMPIDTSGRPQLLGMLGGGVISRAYPVNPTYEQVYNLLVSIDEDLAAAQTVLENSQRLPTDANPMEITDPAHPTTKLKVGTVEMRALLVAVRALRSALGVALAYNLGFDVNTYPYDDPFWQSYSTYLNGADMAGSVYLPGGNFGKLYANGGSRLVAFRTQGTGAIDASFTALDAYNARTGTGWVLNPGQITAGEEADYRTNAAKVKRALNEIYQVESGLSINVPAFCSNPPANLVALAPTMRVVEYDPQWHYGGLMHHGSDFPDRTFGGLFTSPVPTTRLGGTAWFDENDSIVDILAGG